MSVCPTLLRRLRSFGLSAFLLYFRFMQTDVFFTLHAISQATYSERRSKFLAFAVPVENEEAVRHTLAEYRRTYHDARHVCYGYVLGADGREAASSDNGEPSGTAGRPILEQIRSRGLTNVLVVVVRYFGGIKLGTSGLCAAYKTAAREALAAAQVVQETVKEQHRLHFDYAVLDRVLRLARENGAEVLNKDFGTDCRLTLSVRRSLAQALLGRLAELNTLKIDEPD